MAGAGATPLISRPLLIILPAVSGISDFHRAKGVLFSGSELQVPIPALTVGDTKKAASRPHPLVEASTSNRGGSAMKRRDFLKVTGVGLAAGTVASPAIAQSSPEGKW